MPTFESDPPTRSRSARIHDPTTSLLALLRQKAVPLRLVSSHPDDLEPLARLLEQCVAGRARPPALSHGRHHGTG